MIKRLIAIIMCIILVSSQLPFVFAEEDEFISFDGKYDQTIKILNTLGILSIEKFGDIIPEDTVTRGEFVAWVMAARIEGGLPEAEDSYFKDVDINHTYAESINAACNMGIIQKDVSGEFKPEEPVTFYQALSMLIRALGYTPDAEAKGGYPTGYLMTASAIDLLKDIKLINEGELLKGTGAQLILNALHTEMMEVRGISNKDFTYETDGNETLLWKTRNIRYAKGIVTATPYTRLTTPNGAGENKLEINNETYDYEGASDDLIGRNVKYYYREDDSNFRVLMIFEDTGLNNSITVDAKDIERIENNSLYYWIDKDTQKDPKKLNISSKLRVVLNGKSTAQSLKESEPESGQITLIESGSNSSYDIAIVKSYVDYVVHNVNIKDKWISDKYDNRKVLSLDEDDIDRVNITNANGDKMELEDIKEWNVLSVASSDDKKLIDIVAVDKSIQGTILEYSNESDKVSVNISDTSYEIVSKVNENNQREPVFNLRIGDKGVFYMDISGRIAGVKREKKADNYAYLVKADVKKGIKKNIDYKLFTTNGEMLTIKSSKNMKINGMKVTEESIPDNLLENGVFKPQLARYELDSNGEIIDLYTVAPSDVDLSENNGNNESSNQPVYKLRAISPLLDDARYFYTGTFGGTLFVTPDTMVLKVPDAENAAVSIDSDYEALNAPDFVDPVKYNVQGFNSDARSLMPDVMIVYHKTVNKTISANSDPVLCVSKITSAVNDVGETKLKVYGYASGSETSFFIKERSQWEQLDIKVGDVIKYALNTRGEISDVLKAFDYENEEIINLDGYQTQTDYGNSFRILYGSVEAREGGMISVDRKYYDSQELVAADKASIVIFNSDTKKFKAGSINELNDYKSYGQHCSKVFVYIKSIVPKLIVIYK